MQALEVVVAVLDALVLHVRCVQALDKIGPNGIATPCPDEVTESRRHFAYEDDLAQEKARRSPGCPPSNIIALAI